MIDNWVIEKLYQYYLSKRIGRPWDIKEDRSLRGLDTNKLLNLSAELGCWYYIWCKDGGNNRAGKKRLSDVCSKVGATIIKSSVAREKLSSKLLELEESNREALVESYINIFGIRKIINKFIKDMHNLRDGSNLLVLRGKDRDHADKYDAGYIGLFD